VAERQGQVGGPRTEVSPELPELSFVYPIPGFTDLRRFVLVRLDAPASGSSSASENAGAQDVLPSGAGAAALLGELPGDSSAEVDESPLYELRSLEQPDVRFMVVVPGAYFADYEIDLDDQECGDLGLTDSADALVLVMLTVGRDAASTTANLLAPVVINARTRAAAQVILTGSDWPVRAPLG
jgi:flagellar assembly factor FliW